MAKRNGVRKRADVGAYCPGAVAIRRACEEIQATWGRAERLRRESWSLFPVRMKVVSVGEFSDAIDEELAYGHDLSREA